MNTTIRMTQRFVVTILALLLMPAANARTFDRWLDVEAVANQELPTEYEHIALLGRYEDGGQFISVRTICTACEEFAPGTPVGPAIVLDGAGIWGTGGVAVDIETSMTPIRSVNLKGPLGLQTPPRLLVLLDNGDIVDLQGIWGTGGVAVEDITRWLPEPGAWTPSNAQIVRSATNLNYDSVTCGKAVALAETTVNMTAYLRADALLGAGLYPAFAVGTEAGCVGLASFENPIISFENPIISFENPIISFENPIISFDEPALGFDEPALGFDEPALGFDEPALGFENPIISMTPTFRRVPGTKDLGFGIAATFAGKLASLRTGSWEVTGSGPVQAQSDVSFGWEFSGLLQPDESPVRGLTSPSIHYDVNGAIELPGTGFPGTPLLISNGSPDVNVAVMPTDNTTILFEPGQVFTLSTDINRIDKGSVFALSRDGQEVVFVPGFDPENFIPGVQPELVLGGWATVTFGPQTFSLSSKGNFVTAVIEGVNDDVLDIPFNSVLLAIGGISPTPVLNPQRNNIADNDGDGNLEMVVKFDRQQLADWLSYLPEGSGFVGLRLSWNNGATDCGESGLEGCMTTYPTVVRIIP